ncbi:MAG: hypothetical protein ACLGI5_16410 [Thermoleophilia bacterium]
MASDGARTGTSRDVDDNNETAGSSDGCRETPARTTLAATALQPVMALART